MNLDRLRDRFFVGAPRYRWISTVGRGGMGVIFKAQDLELDDEVAIKVLAPDLDSDDQELLARFKREIQLNRKIKHPNVARIHDFGTSGDYPYITMEYIPGVDLRTAIQREGRLVPEHAISILRQILLGTEAAHKLGIIHRDLKSQNVMVEESGAVAILDFGLARGKLNKNENLTIDSIMIGTPHYMPPEQALGKATDARSDIYSIGVMMFECLTGHVPFTGESPLVIAMKQVSEPAPEEPLQRAHVPPDLAAIVLRALAKDPAERFASAAALEAELGIVQLLPLPAEPVPEPQVAAPPPISIVVPDTPVTARPRRPIPVPPPTEVVFTSPPVARVAKSASSSGMRPPVQVIARAPVILVVEDDQFERDRIAQALGAWRCRVIEARNGQRALETLLKQPVDLVLLDLTLPDMDGFDVTRVIKSQPDSAQLPIVLMANRLDRSRFAFGIQSGATDLLPKPLSLEAAVVRIWNILQHRGFVPPSELASVGSKPENMDPRFTSARPTLLRSDTPA